MYVDRIFCDRCHYSVSAGEPVTVCPECWSPLTIAYHFDRIKDEFSKKSLLGRKRNIFRYRELLPVADRPLSLGEGWTPVVKSTSLLGNSDFSPYFKLEYVNPTGSFKDRGTAVTVSRAREWEVEKVADDSSGNAGASLAAYAAKAEIDCEIYVPRSTSGEKIEQIKSYGADLHTVPGPRENTAQKIKEDTEDGDIHYASHNLSPYFPEGMKTVSYEISEQFDWDPPEHLVLPVGGGALMVGIYRGFRDLVKLNWIDEVPRLHAVQTESCNPVVEAFRDSRKVTKPVEVRPTVAEGMHVANPDRGREILEAIYESGGRALEVTESEVKEYHHKLAREEGVFAEPTSAVPVAGVKRLNEEVDIKPGERILVPITGFGLKDVRAS